MIIINDKWLNGSTKYPRVNVSKHTYKKYDDDDPKPEDEKTLSETIHDIAELIDD